MIHLAGPPTDWPHARNIVKVAGEFA